MPVSLPSPSSALFNPSLQAGRCTFSVGPSRHSLINFQRSFPKIRSSNASSVNTDLSTELDAVSIFSEIVPDTVVFDDFEKFPPTAATVSSSLLLGISSLPDASIQRRRQNFNFDPGGYIIKLASSGPKSKDQNYIFDPGGYPSQKIWCSGSKASLRTGPTEQAQWLKRC